MIKSVYFASRRNHDSHAEFLENWRRHAKLSESFPSITRHYQRVVQCGLMTEFRRPGLCTRYSGMNLLSMTGLVEAVDVYDDPNVEVMLADEERIFAEPTIRSLLVAHESVLVPVRERSVVLLECVRRAPGSGPADFIRNWTGDYGAAIAATASVRSQLAGYVHNHVILPAPDSYPFDGISEMWFEDAGSALALLDNKELQDIRDRQ